MTTQTQAISETLDYVLSGVYAIFLRSKDKFAKASQYLALLICWVYEREQKDLAEQYFLVYKRIFTCRRLFRLGKFVNYLPQIKQGIYQVKRQPDWQKVSRLLTNISRYAFYLCDNLAVCMQITGSQVYHLMRRISFSVLLIALISSIVNSLIRLKNTFGKEAALKKQLTGDFTPKQFLIRLSDIDSERRSLTYELVSRFGDLLPTLQRMNLPQVLLRTRINKLSVGFFGLVGALSQIISINRLYTF